MRLFQVVSDGGENSGVTAFVLVEIKCLFSIMLLKFSPGTRDAYHSHAFNAWTLWLSGFVAEHRILFPGKPWFDIKTECFTPGDLKYTPRENMHQVESIGTSWCLTLRGPWRDRWQEFKDGKLVTLTHGRKVVSP